MRHLPFCVDSCIGTARCKYCDFFLGYFLQGFLENFLDGDSIRLNLPAMISSAIIFDYNFEFLLHAEYISGNEDIKKEKILGETWGDFIFSVIKNALVVFQRVFSLLFGPAILRSGKLILTYDQFLETSKIQLLKISAY